MVKFVQNWFCNSVVVSFLSLVGTATSTETDTWPQWRGPNRDAKVTYESWPTKLSAPEVSISWSVSQGPSYSGPVVATDKVFVTETRDKKYEVVRAFDRFTGQILWETEWEGAMIVPFFAASNGSWIRSTPAYDGQRLYVAGIRDVLVCLDANTGATIWELDFVAQTGSKLPSFGFVSSPLVTGNHVYVQAGGGLSKLDKLTGDIIWRTLDDGGGMYGSAFSSPVLATMDGVRQLVAQTRKKLAGVDLQTGKVLWSEDIPAFRGMNILTPTVIDNHVFTSSYGGRSTMFEVSLNGSTWTVTKEWDHKSQGYMSSPVVIDDHIYMHLRNRRFICLDARTGEQRWITKPFGKYWSLVANGTKLLALDQTGELLLIDASPDEFKLLDRCMVADESWAHLAVVDQQIFVRDLNAMTVFSWR